MAKIKNTTAYPTVTPAANDLIIGTDVSDNKKTVTFTVSSIGGGAAVNQDLNSVLGVGNTSNLNIELNGDQVLVQKIYFLKQYLLVAWDHMVRQDKY